MDGIVNVDRAATPSLTIRGANGQDEVIEAVIDTGFSGFLTLPLSLISSLALPWRGREQAVLGDGSLHLFDVYEAEVIWDDRDRVVEVDTVDSDPLIGMSFLYGYEIRIQVIEGGRVVAEKLSG